jgi:hypothetical protein
VIDSLRLARRTQLSKEQAEALAECLDESLVSKEYLEAAFSRIKRDVLIVLLALMAVETALTVGVAYFMR